MTAVEREDRDGVAILRLNDPARRNALSPGMVRALVERVEQCEADEAVSAVMITGEGSTFCAGAELDSLRAAAAGDQDRLREVYQAFLRVARCALPTVAAVNGPAVGAGLNLALACDVRIAAPRARFDCRFAALGLHPGGGHTWMLDRAVGRQTAAAMLLFGQALDGQAAACAGLALRCVPADELLDNAVELASRAARAPRELITLITASMRAAATVADLDTAVDAEFGHQVWSLQQPWFTARISGRG